MRESTPRIGERGDGEPKAEANSTASPSCRPRPPEGLVDLAEHVPGVVLDIRYATTRNFTGEVLPGYEVAAAWLARAPADALVKVQADLAREGYGLVIFDAYRPIRATDAMVAWAERHGHGDWLEAGYIARTSTHARATTVDLGLVEVTPDGVSVVDMGSAFDAFGVESHYRQGGPAQAQRARLRRAMTKHGFVPYASEWWHFSFAKAKEPRRDVPYACPRDG